jgi:hypothetical protein
MLKKRTPPKRGSVSQMAAAGFRNQNQGIPVTAGSSRPTEKEHDNEAIRTFMGDRV